MKEKTVAVLFGGIGGFSTGAIRAKVEYGGQIYKYKLLVSIDCDPVACRNHDIVTGEQTSLVMDLFSRQQYIDFHGKEPSSDWQEITPWNIWEAFKYQVPNKVFLSPPCKGFSGLLPAKSAESKKYQALNLLTLRGLELTLKACEEYGGYVPDIIHFENVPRITSRGKNILFRIKILLYKYGYEVDMNPSHNLGEVGGLGQNRIRFQIMARQQQKIPNLIYLPTKKRLQTIGEVIGPLPSPGDIKSCGWMNRVPKLQWKTWVRLALILAGGDWRNLNRSCYANIYQVVPYQKHAPTVTGANRPNNGSISVADPRIKYEPRSGAFKIVKWDNPGPTITGSTGAGRSNGISGIADPRLNCKPRAGSYKVQRWNENSNTVTGGDIHSGSAAVADQRIPEETENGVWLIIAEDGTWHRPLTTYEMAILQSFPRNLPDSRPFQLEGCNEAKAREYIGNAYPPDTAEVTCMCTLIALAKSDFKVGFELSWEKIWVSPQADQLEKTDKRLIPEKVN